MPYTLHHQPPFPSAPHPPNPPHPPLSLFGACSVRELKNALRPKVEVKVKHEVHVKKVVVLDVEAIRKQTKSHYLQTSHTFSIRAPKPMPPNAVRLNPLTGKFVLTHGEDDRFGLSDMIPIKLHTLTPLSKPAEASNAEPQAHPRSSSWETPEGGIDSACPSRSSSLRRSARTSPQSSSQLSR